MDYSDFDRVNATYDSDSTALVRPVKPTERTRDILSRWPAFNEPYTTLFHAVSTLRAYESDARRADVVPTSSE